MSLLTLLFKVAKVMCRESEQSNICYNVVEP